MKIEKIAVIGTAFDSLTRELIASGKLENDPSLEKAVVTLSLHIARAAGDSSKIKDAEDELQALNPVLLGLDLRSFSGWVAAAKALLEDKPSGTALVDTPFQGLLVLEQGELYAIPNHAVEDNQVVTEWGIPVDGYQPDISIWSDLHQAWESHDPMTNRDVLLIPKFVQYEKKELASL